MTGSLRLRSLLAASVSLVAVTAVAAPAFAQDTTVGEVVVTAQKREEAIQDVPIAVSAFSQDTLEKAKIDGGPNLVLAIPNVNFSKGNFTGYNFQIRGVGAKLVAGSGDAGTGIHLNNAPLTANNLFESDFFDVERVEVLRGPQGTLYGRNATGGVVNIITAKPTDDFTASLRGEVGNFGTKKVRGMVNIPLGDMFAVRLAGNVLQRDGFGKNLTTGNDVDDRDLWNTRITVGFNPTDTFNTTLMWDHFEEDDKRSRIGKQLCTKDPGPANIGGMNFLPGPAGVVQRGFFSQGCSPTPVNSAGILGTPNSQGTLGGLFGALFGFTTGDQYAGQMQDPDIRNIQSSFDPIYQAKTDIVQFNITWDLSDELQLTSLTGYSKNSLFTRQDYNRIVPNQSFNTTPNPVNALAAMGPAYTALYASLFPGGVINDPQLGPLNKFATADISSGDAKQWSQELRLQSNFDGPFNFNIGAIYIDYKNDGDYYVMGNTLTAAALVQNSLPPAATVTGCSTATPCAIDPNQTPNRSGRNYYDNTGAYHLKSRAAFGEVYWQLTDDIRITGGLRYTHDMKRQENRPVVLNSPGSGIPLSTAKPFLTADFKETTGRFNIDWKPDLSFTDDTLIYLSYSRGYKAGGMNPACSASVFSSCPSETFEPEFVDAWEIGAKNTLLGGAMVLNLTGFNYDYIGYQVSKIVNRTSVNENIDAKIRGVEFETVWSPIDGLRLNANIGYLKTEIENGETSIDVFNRTQGDPNLTLMKSSAASNCVLTTAGAQAVLGFSNGLAGPPPNPFALLQACTLATTVPAGTRLFPGGPLALGRNPFGQLVSDGYEVDLGGNSLPNSPEWTFSIGAQYTWTLFGDWDATIRADYYRQTESFSRIYNAATDKLDGWDNANATLTVTNSAAGWTFEAYVKNMMDETVLTDTYLTDDSSGLFRNGFYGEPRTYGVAVTKSF
ncbi:TonB-dependent receptor [Caulobacter mirabilis]|uniref:TonB-dependent receptor n=1 Tax=Caulobacter mirabilis TaxID=69666 RepID=A0A2D2AVA7_9CAUL|nr:TonB-dependent receptor [Caulobacter mirabilis]ATQ41915.1 TonB-dependent receptor [Caulobacter mirabilis]